MKKYDFWLISLIALWIIAEVTEWNVFMRVAVGANAVVVLIDTVRKIREVIRNAGKA